MSFIATSTVSSAGEALHNDGFFPDIDLDALRDTQRLDGTVTLSRLKSEVVEAMLAVNTELNVWRQTRIAEGFKRMEDIDAIDNKPIAKVADESALVLRYKRAVYCLTHAEIIERYRNFDATASARQEGNESRTGAEELRRSARWAISDILGQRRNTVELI